MKVNYSKEKNMLRFMILFFTGAVGYSVLEIIWRGYTHWTMFILGGICFVLLYGLFEHIPTYPVIVKAALGGALITVLEFISGYIVNIRLHWNVWSYSYMPHNFLGQICLGYSLLWTLLCVPLSYLCSFFRHYIG